MKTAPSYELICLPSTQLHNRRGLDVAVEQLVPADGGQIGVLAVDIDKFKAINDAFGHDAGDRVLVSVANATRDAVSAVEVHAVIARTGGEEFVVAFFLFFSLLFLLPERFFRNVLIIHVFLFFFLLFLLLESFFVH